MGHKGNRCQTEYGDATWRTTWRWQRSVVSDCFSSYDSGSETKDAGIQTHYSTYYLDKTKYEQSLFTRAGGVRSEKATCEPRVRTHC